MPKRPHGAPKSGMPKKRQRDQNEDPDDTEAGTSNVQEPELEFTRQLFIPEIKGVDPSFKPVLAETTQALRFPPLDDVICRMAPTDAQWKDLMTRQENNLLLVHHKRSDSTTHFKVWARILRDAKPELAQQCVDAANEIRKDNTIYDEFSKLMMNWKKTRGMKSNIEVNAEAYIRTTATNIYQSMPGLRRLLLRPQLEPYLERICGINEREDVSEDERVKLRKEVCDSLEDEPLRYQLKVILDPEHFDKDLDERTPYPNDRELDSIHKMWKRAIDERTELAFAKCMFLMFVQCLPRTQVAMFKYLCACQDLQESQYSPHIVFCQAENKDRVRTWLVQDTQDFDKRYLTGANINVEKDQSYKDK